MADNHFDNLLNQARQLSTEDKQRLIRELLASMPDASQPRSLFDALKARGLIGCMEDGPPDLSTNPKYMEGFGQDSWPERDS